MNYIERGKYNDIQSKDIGEGTIFSGWTYVDKTAKIGKNCRFGNHVVINSDVVIGDSVNMEAYSILTSGTKVGSHVFIGAYVACVDEKYQTNIHEDKIKFPIIIQSHAQIATGTLLVCCKIGHHSVTGTGALVLKDIPPNEVWIGQPAKFYCTRQEFDKKQLESKAKYLKTVS